VLCRIHVTESAGQSTVAVAGRFAAGHVAALLDACARASGRLRIDLTEMLSADVAGKVTLRDLADAGAELVGLARYLQFELAPTPQDDRRRDTS
jgi:hypothetical protein